MAEKDIKKLVKTVKSRLTKTATTFRKNLDLTTHSLYINSDQIYNDLWYELGFISEGGRKNIPKFHGLIESAKNNANAKQAVEDLNTFVKEQAKYIAKQTLLGAIKDKRRIDAIPQGRRKYKSYVDIQLNSRTDFIVTIFLRKGDTPPFKNWRGEMQSGSVFSSLRSYYKNAADEAGKKIAVKLGYSENTTRKPRIHLGHFEDDAVVKQRKEDIVKYFNIQLKKIQKKNPKVTKELLEQLGFKIFFEYKSDIDRTVTRVTAQSAKKNLKLSANERRVLDDIRGALNNVDFANLGGSDSRVEIETKKILKSFENGLKIGKNLKLEKANTKIEFSQHNKELSLLPKIKTGRTIVADNLGIKGTKSRKISSAESTIALAALINQKLPQTVMANMKPPALQNRTGRFAQSVRVTDVMQTPRGYPSIGYTYRKNPYQTFEMGQKQGSKDRDPRTLIDRSIRQIAAQLLVGRFFTRRN